MVSQGKGIKNEGETKHGENRSAVSHFSYLNAKNNRRQFKILTVCQVGGQQCHRDWIVE